MRKIVLKQDKFIVMASILKSEALLYCASTSLNVRKVNSIIKKSDRYIEEMLKEGLCRCEDGEYVLDYDIKMMADICSKYVRKIEKLVHVGLSEYKAVETMFISEERY